MGTRSRGGHIYLAQVRNLFAAAIPAIPCKRDNDLFFYYAWSGRAPTGAAHLGICDPCSYQRNVFFFGGDFKKISKRF